MDLPQQQSPSPPSLVTSHVDGEDQSVPPTPISPISPTQKFHNTLRVDAYQRRAPHPSPAVTSSNPVKPAKRKRLVKVSNLLGTIFNFLIDGSFSSGRPATRVTVANADAMGLHRAQTGEHFRPVRASTCQCEVPRSDFSGKSCTYTDPSGRAVAPPRTRSVDLRTSHDSWPYPVKNSYSGNLDHSSNRRLPLSTTLNSSPSPLDAKLTRELVNRM
jgi:hypothetical protein